MADDIQPVATAGLTSQFITLRDWRAMSALTGLLPTETENLIAGTRTPPQLAALAYSLADAMAAVGGSNWDESNWETATWG